MSTAETTPQRTPEPVDADHPAMLTFTSGSTGAPRGVVRSHGFLDVQQRAVVRDLELTAGQRDLSTMPVFVLANLAAGVHSILADADLRRPAAADPERLMAQIVRHRADRILASPALLDRLADACLSRRARLDSIDRVDTGGAPVFPRTLDKLRVAMPRAKLMVVYGSTEAEPIAMLDATRNDPALRERIMQGEGLPTGELATDLDVQLVLPAWGEAIGPLRADAFAARCLPAGHVGEIVVCGQRVIRGYLDGVGDEQTKIHVGGRIWHRTGDLGRFDAAGRLWLLGRAGAQLADARGVVEPLAVEAAAMGQAGIARCALLAIAGQRVLVVQLAAHAPQGWHDELLERLAWAQLDRVLTVRRLPVDLRHNAKIDYPALRRLVGADDAGRSTRRTVPAAPSISTRSPS